MVDEITPPKPQPIKGRTAEIRKLKVGENRILLGTVHRLNMLAKQVTNRTGRRFACRTISATAVRVWRLS